MTGQPAQVAVVTGASRGIGRVIAEGLAKEGAHVVAVARSADGLAEAAAAIRSRGGTATAIAVDLRELEAVDRLAGEIGDRFGRIDMLVGNAGLLGSQVALGELDPQVWHDVIAVNLTANWYLVRAFDKLLHRSAAGRAVFITAGSPRNIVPNWGIYTISKSALETMVRVYATELRGSSVRANLFNPGPVRAGMRLVVAPDEDPTTLDPPEMLLPQLAYMLSPAFNEQCVLYDYPTKTSHRFEDG